MLSIEKIMKVHGNPGKHQAINVKTVGFLQNQNLFLWRFNYEEQISENNSDLRAGACERIHLFNSLYKICVL